MNAVLQTLADPGPAAKDSATQNLKKRRFDQVSNGDTLKTEEQLVHTKHRDRERQRERQRERAEAAAAPQTQRKQDRQHDHTILENDDCEDLYVVQQVLGSRFGPVDSDGQELCKEFLVNWVDRDSAENEWVPESRLRDPDDLDSSERVNEFLARRTHDQKVAEEVENAVVRICDLVVKESATTRREQPRSKKNQCAAEIEVQSVLEESEQKEEDEKLEQGHQHLAVTPMSLATLARVADSKNNETALDSNQSAESARGAASQVPGTCVSTRMAGKKDVEPVQGTKRKKADTTAMIVIE